jgi:hypothetical protein
VEVKMMFLECPAYLDEEGAARCGLPAEVKCRFVMRSTDGPLECAMIRCPAGHWFNGPIESLTWESTDKHDPGTAGAAARAGRDSLRGSHDDGDGGGGFTHPARPAEPEPGICRRNTAPAYYLGRPACLWMTAIRPHRQRTTPDHPRQTVTGGGKPTPSPPAAPLTGAGAPRTGHRGPTADRKVA